MRRIEVIHRIRENLSAADEMLGPRRRTDSEAVFKVSASPPQLLFQSLLGSHFLFVLPSTLKIVSADRREKKKKNPDYKT